MKTIQKALSIIYADSLNQSTIWLYPGTYSKQTTGEFFPLDIFSFVKIAGSSINETILDAESINTVIRFMNSTNSGISNLTVMNGLGGETVYDEFGGGITCVNSPNPTIENVAILNNISHNGSGIYCIESNPTLINVTIFENSGWNGGGMYCKYSDPILRNVYIFNNTASRGGGLYLTYGSVPLLENVTVSNNVCTFGGGGVYLNLWANIDFHEDIRSNIFSNFTDNSRDIGNDIYHMLPNDEDVMHVVVDTFTVMNPTDFYVHPIDYFTFDIQNSIQDDLVNADVYVSIEGSDSNSGLSQNDPFKTIQYALSRIYTDAQNPHTIFLAPGVYSPETNGDFFPLELLDNLTLSGNSANETILDASFTNSVIRIQNSSNIVIRNVTIKDGEAPYGHGGGIYFNFSNPRIENVILKNNHAERGAGMFCTNSEAVIINTIFQDNIASYSGGAFYSAGDIIFINTTFVNNIAYSSGGWMTNISSTHLTFTNCISYYNNPQETYLESSNFDPTTVTISFSNIQGGLDSIEIEDNGELFWLEGNINADPQFVGTGSYVYALSENSPCIDVGTPDTLGLNLPPWDIIGNERVWDGNEDGVAAIDIGAFEFGAPEYVSINEEEFTINYFKLSNYPNPFNPETKIAFDLTESGEVSLELYNIKGQKIKTLLNRAMQKGNHSVIWNGTDNLGKPVCSGIYLYRLTTENKVKTNRMLLLK